MPSRKPHDCSRRQTLTSRARQFKEAAKRRSGRWRFAGSISARCIPMSRIRLSQLGNIAYRQGQYDRAEALIADALKIREATLGPNHLDVAESLSDLASMLLVRGDYVRPEPLYQRALAIYEKTLDERARHRSRGEVQALIAGVLNNLALPLSQERRLRSCGVSVPEGSRDQRAHARAGRSQRRQDAGEPRRRVLRLRAVREGGAGPAARARHPGTAQ